MVPCAEGKAAQCEVLEPQRGLRSLTSEPMESIEGYFVTSDCVGTLAREGIWGNNFSNLIPE